MFPVREVVVRGDEGLLEGALEAVIRESVPRGTNLLFFRGRGLRRRLEAEPGVATVRVMRKLPHTLVVEMVQRKPFAILKRGSQRVFCDREGMILEVEDAGTNELPVVEVEVLSPRQFAPGEKVEGQRVRSALEAISFLCEASAQIPRRVRFSRRHGMEIELTDGPRLALGTPVRLEEKLRACLSVLDRPWEKNPVSVIDVSCQDSSYYEVSTQ